MRAGQADRQFDLDEGRRGSLPAAGAKLCRNVWRGRGRGHGLRREGPGRHQGAQGRDLHARLQAPDREDRLRARGHHLRSERVRGRHRHRGARQLRRRFHRGDARDPPRCRMSISPAACRTCPSRSAATSRCARRCMRCSSITRSSAAWTWASSMPGSSPSTTTIEPELREACEDVVLNRLPSGRTRPSGCWRSPNGSRAPRARKPRKRTSPGANGRWNKRISMRWSTASPSSSTPTRRRRG
jgi:hypothetical protein